MMIWFYFLLINKQNQNTGHPTKPIKPKPNISTGSQVQFHHFRTRVEARQEPSAAWAISTGKTSMILHCIIVMFDDESTITIVSSLKYIHSTVNRNFVTYVYIYNNNNNNNNNIYII